MLLPPSTLARKDLGSNDGGDWVVTTIRGLLSRAGIQRGMLPRSNAQERVLVARPPKGRLQSAKSFPPSWPKGRRRQARPVVAQYLASVYAWACDPHGNSLDYWNNLRKCKKATTGDIGPHRARRRALSRQVRGEGAVATEIFNPICAWRLVIAASSCHSPYARRPHEEESL
jgi:hypothetical protein